jgi:hypothetical protein
MIESHVDAVILDHAGQEMHVFIGTE